MHIRKRQQRIGLEKTVRHVLQSPWAQLDADLRRFAEKRFGRDFGQVRVHADDLAACSARHLNAKAYTAGSHRAITRSPTRSSMSMRASMSPPGGATRPTGTHPTSCLTPATGRPSSAHRRPATAAIPA
jgi:hypothetical protein